MQVVGSKLSKHVLGMKFMRKTKDNLDQDSTEQSHRKHFGVKVDVQKKSDLINQPSVNADKNRKPSTSTTYAASDPSSTVTAVIEETSSYSQCLGYSFGRVSFGGFNPTVEYNVKRGIWRTGFNVGQDQSDEDDESKEKDISDSEMAELRANVIGSMERRFKTKKQRGGQDADRDNPILEETSGTSSKRKGRQPNWKKKNAEEQQQGSSSSSWFNGHGQPLKKSSSSADHKSPPQKKRKFMKPSDD
jgi:hypothetical protein